MLGWCRFYEQKTKFHHYHYVIKWYTLEVKIMDFAFVFILGHTQAIKTIPASFYPTPVT